MLWLELGLIGLSAGLCGGMLGVGGSIIMIPAMTEVLGPAQHRYQAAAMIVNFFVVVPAVYQHRRAKAIDSATVKRLIPIAGVSVLIGVGLSELPFFAGAGEVYLRSLFGFFLLSISLYDLYRLLRRSPRLPLSPERARGHGSMDKAGETPRALSTASPAGLSLRGVIAVAVPTGLIAGLLGVGGGILAVPLQRRFLRIPIRSAIANSAAMIVATSFLGASAKNYAFMTRHDGAAAPWMLAAVLIPLAFLGSSIGARFTHRLPLKVVKSAFFVLLSLAAVRITYRAVSDIAFPTLPTAEVTRAPFADHPV